MPVQNKRAVTNIEMKPIAYDQKPNSIKKRRKTREELVSFDPTKDLSNDEIIGLKEDIKLS